MFKGAIQQSKHSKVDRNDFRSDLQHR